MLEKKHKDSVWGKWGKAATESKSHRTSTASKLLWLAGFSSREDPRSPGALLANEIHLVFVALFGDFELDLGAGGVFDEFSSAANALGVGEEFFLHFFGDVLFDQDVVPVVL